MKKINCIGFSLLLLLIVGCEKVRVEHGEQKKVSAVLIEVHHEPARTEQKFGYHFSAWKGKFVFGPHLKRVPEENIVRIELSSNSNVITLDDKRICTKLLDKTHGHPLAVTYVDTFYVTYKNKEPVKRQFAGIKIVDINSE